MKVNVSRSVTTPVVTADGERLVSHAGVGMLAEVADRTGLTAGLTRLFTRQGLRWRRHPPGVTLVRAAAAIATGMSNVSTVGLFCSSRAAIFERPASLSTVRRAVFALGGELMTPGLDRVLAAARSRAWDAAGYAPASLTIDVDATLLACHSDKEQAAPTYKSGYGFHPLGMWLDETREPLAMVLRPGNAGSNTAADHCDVLLRSIDQLPAALPGRTSDRRRSRRGGPSDPGAGGQRGGDQGLPRRAGGPQHRLLGRVHHGRHDPRPDRTPPPSTAWRPAVNTDHSERHGAQVIELCGFTGTNGWPRGARLICRREDPHPGATLSLFDQIHGRRHTLFLTDSTDPTSPGSSCATVTTPGSRTASAAGKPPAPSASPTGTPPPTKPG